MSAGALGRFAGPDDLAARRDSGGFRARRRRFGRPPAAIRGPGAPAEAKEAATAAAAAGSGGDTSRSVPMTSGSSGCFARRPREGCPRTRRRRLLRLRRRRRGSDATRSLSFFSASAICSAIFAATAASRSAPRGGRRRRLIVPRPLFAHAALYAPQSAPACVRALWYAAHAAACASADPAQPATLAATASGAAEIVAETPSSGGGAMPGGRSGSPSADGGTVPGGDAIARRGDEPACAGKCQICAAFARRRQLFHSHVTPDPFARWQASSSSRREMMGRRVRSRMAPR